MQMLPTETRAVRDELLKLGFLEDLLLSEMPLPWSHGRTALLAFANRPLDSRTAVVAATDGPPLSASDVHALRPTGAAVVFSCQADRYQVWKQGSARAEFVCPLTSAELPGFFREHAKDLSPGAIYRAKTWARLDPAYQSELFVDAGLLPAVEEHTGEQLRKLVERVVSITKRALGWSSVSDKDGQWLLKAVFWLLAAKILHDKAVPGFVRLALTDLDNVYARLAKHYNSEAPNPVLVGSRQRRDALQAAAEEIERFPHCGLVSTEALAHLYESALIDRATRQRLGTHSTPPWLVDYVVGRLRPWIESIPVESRCIFEPACGHAAFLISAMRLLAELLPANWPEPRRTYLRRRLHGMESDTFALEIARLSLTLADVPHPNGWALTQGNMFAGDRLERGVRDASIVLGNPPFEYFGEGEGDPAWLLNKAAETFRRVTENLRPGGVFGFILPQALLHNEQTRGVREMLLREYEISEISLFADQVFRHGDSESALVLGRRFSPTAPRHFFVRYQRIREGQVGEFSKTCVASSSMQIDRSRLLAAEATSLVVPELDDLWQHLAGMSRLEQFAEIGQGFSHISTQQTVKSETRTPGFQPGFAGWDEEQPTHSLPKVVWLNLDPTVIARPRHGTSVGEQQLIFNYAPVSRRAWRLKALIDEKGHPVTSRFNVLRPNQPQVSLLALWGLFNSPLANAYASCHTDKRNVLAGVMRRMPVPSLTTCDLEPLERVVSEYLCAARALRKTRSARHSEKREAHVEGAQLSLFKGAPSARGEEEDRAAGGEADDRLKLLHWRVDAEVLRLYDLPANLERRLLDLFSDTSRRGVPFAQTEYFPKGYAELERLDDLIAITFDWKKTNRRRGQLLALEEEERLTPAQVRELADLQRLADALLCLMAPWKTDEVDRAVRASKERGRWEE